MHLNAEQNMGCSRFGIAPLFHSFKTGTMMCIYQSLILLVDLDISITSVEKYTEVKKNLLREGTEYVTG